MRYLLLSSCLLLLGGCSSVYKNLRPAAGNINAINKFRPDFKSVLYKADIDVTTHHLSGILIIKTLPDSSVRVVFSAAMGFKFFDFEFKPNGDFKVFYVVSQMNKKPVIKTLRKDFDLILFNLHTEKPASLLKDSTSLYYVFPKQKGSFCYITDLPGTKITGIEICSPHKPIVNAMMANFKDRIPDTIGITHNNFKFNIGLKRILQ
jgi:hypothetical protein